jgi:hypothetical protein
VAENLIHTSSEEGRKAFKALGYKELKAVEDPGDPKGKLYVFDRTVREVPRERLGPRSVPVTGKGAES